MNSEQLVKFKKITETGSLTAAAEALYLTQSTLSHSLNDLEKELGCTLFERVHRKMMLTEEGKILLPYATAVVNMIEQAKNAIASRNIIRISASDICVAFMLSFFSEEMLKRITLKQIDEPEMPQMLRDGMIDIVVCDSYYMRSFRESDEIRLRKKTVCNEQLGLFVPKGHPFYEKDSVTYYDLEKEPLCIRMDNLSLSVWVDNIQSSLGYGFNIEYSMDRYAYDMIRKKISYPEICCVNSFYNPDFQMVNASTDYKFVKIEGEYSSREVYLWYLERNEEKIVPVLDSLSEFYGIRDKKVQAMKWYEDHYGLK